MADNVNEESEYKDSGKDELDWGYEEGKLVFISMWRDAGKYVVLAGLFFKVQHVWVQDFTVCVVYYLLARFLLFWIEFCSSVNSDFKQDINYTNK